VEQENQTKQQIGKNIVSSQKQFFSPQQKQKNRVTNT
jgi:hypothetical protein